MTNDQVIEDDERDYLSTEELLALEELGRLEDMTE